MRHDMWMTTFFGTQRCAILSFAALEPRVFAWWNVIMLCNTVHAVFVSRQPKPVLTLRKIPVVRAWRMLRVPIARLPMGLVPRWRRWRSCLQVGPRSWRSFLQVSPRPVVEPSTCFRVNRVVIFFVASNCCLFAVLFVDCEEWFCILVGFLPGARHAIVCILFSLEQSQVVDAVIAEVLLHLSWESNASNFEFSQLL